MDEFNNKNSLILMYILLYIGFKRQLIIKIFSTTERFSLNIVLTAEIKSVCSVLWMWSRNQHVYCGETVKTGNNTETWAAIGLS